MTKWPITVKTPDREISCESKYELIRVVNLLLGNVTIRNNLKVNTVCVNADNLYIESTGGILGKGDTVKVDGESVPGLQKVSVSLSVFDATNASLDIVTTGERG